MSKLGTFKRNKCISALLKLDFSKKNTRRGKHDKYAPPAKYSEKREINQPPFIMIPRGRTLYCQDEIVKELHNLGGEELVKKLTLIKITSFCPKIFPKQAEKNNLEI